MDRPVPLSRYIALCVKEASEEVRKSWYRIVCDTAPNGVITTVPVDGKPVCLVTSLHGETSWLKVPLTRDLLDQEAESIVNAFAAEHPDLDFDVRVSSSAAEQLGADTMPVTVDKDRYVALCTAWAKSQHDRWMKERLDAGWRYGPTISLSARTHPLLRPWPDLPEQFRKIDLDEPQKLLDLLNDQGYALITRDELQSLMNLMRGIA